MLLGMYKKREVTSIIQRLTDVECDAVMGMVRSPSGLDLVELCCVDVQSVGLLSKVHLSHHPSHQSNLELTQTLFHCLHSSQELLHQPRLHFLESKRLQRI